MLSNVKFKNVEVVGKGSVYENKSGKQTMGFAFYYIVNGGKKNRKVVTASSKEECLEKATAFLDKLDKEYEEKKKAVSKNSVTANFKQTFNLLILTFFSLKIYHNSSRYIT